MTFAGIETYIKFIKAHETVLAMVLAAAVIFGAWGHIENIIQRHDASNEVQAQIVATAQAKQNAAISAQVAVDNAAFAALQAKVQASNAALIQANVALATALTKQQKIDATLPSTDLVARWNMLVPSANVAVSANGETLPNSGAVATVQQLELVPVQQQELADTRAIVQNDSLLLGASQKQVTDLNSLVSGLNLKAVDDKAVCTAEIKVVKDAARKRERWIGVIGLVLGYALRGRM
jgi:hypothetical protein